MGQDQVRIFDTTLRDGEQAPGFSLRPSEKLALARQLDALGVDIIEAGFPIASPADAEAVRTIATEIRRPVIACLARCHKADLERAAWALEPAEQGRIHTFIATSDLHLQAKLRMTREQCLETAVESVRFARQPHLRRRVLGRGRDAQRLRLPVPGHRGGHRGRRHDGQPARHGRLHHAGRDPRLLHEASATRVPNAGDVVFSTHCHDDLGLAAANSHCVGARRRASGRVHDQRHRRARRQRGARRGRDGVPHPPGPPAVHAPTSTSRSSTRRASCSRSSRDRPCR